MSIIILFYVSHHVQTFLFLEIFLDFCLQDSRLTTSSVLPHFLFFLIFFFFEFIFDNVDINLNKNVRKVSTLFSLAFVNCN